MASTNFVAKNGLTVASGTVVAGGSSGSNGQVLSSTGTGVQWVNASSASGDVVGPASSTDNAIVRFDSTTGKLIQNSTATLSDGGIMIVTELDTDSIKSATANSPIVIAPDGTGDVHLNADSVRIGDNNADATIATRGTGDLIITTNEGSAVEGIVRLYDGANGNITLTPNGTGQVQVGTDQVVTLVASQTLTNKTISGSANTLSNIANASLTNSTISGVALGGTLATLTLNTSGTGLSGSQTYNGSGAATFTVASNATNANTASTIVARDASGNFSAGTITATLSGNATNVTGTVAVANGGTGSATLTSGSYVVGAGTSAVTLKTPTQVTADLDTFTYQIGVTAGKKGLVPAAPAVGGPETIVYLDNSGGWTTPSAGGTTTNALTISSPLTGTSFNGSAAVSIGIPAATTSVSGYLSSADWTTFNSKGSGTVTSVTGGTYLTGGTITTTGTLAVDATSANTASKVVARDASGNFSAGTITASLTGNASGSSGSCTGNSATATSAATLTTARTINTTSFNGSADITIGSKSNIGTPSAAGTNYYGTIYVTQTASPTGGSTGDLYLVY